MLQLDIQEFLAKFEESIDKRDAESIKEYGDDRWIRRPAIFNQLDVLMQDDTVVKTFTCGEVDDYGRIVSSTYTVNAYSSKHACMKAAILSNDMEWFTSGYYGAKEIDLDLHIDAARTKVDYETNKFNDLLRLKRKL
tara:strand:- start:45 stop:455 length:411 start_codon:yes stop_codon:yes gene_type:complete